MEGDNTNVQLVNSFCIDGRHPHTHPHTHTCLHTHARTYTIHPVPSGVRSTSRTLSRHLEQSSPYLAIFSHSRLFNSAFMLVFFSFYHPLLSSMLSCSVITLAAIIHQFTQNPVNKLTAFVHVIFFYTSISCTHSMYYCNLPSIKGNLFFKYQYCNIK